MPYGFASLQIVQVPDGDTVPVCVQPAAAFRDADPLQEAGCRGEAAVAEQRRHAAFQVRQGHAQLPGQDVPGRRGDLLGRDVLQRAPQALRHTEAVVGLAVLSGQPAEDRLPA